MPCPPVELCPTQRISPAEVESQWEPLVQIQCPIPADETAAGLSVLLHSDKDSMVVEPVLLCGWSMGLVHGAALSLPPRSRTGGNRDQTGNKARQLKGRHAHGIGRVA
jgi:hypothetical protein